MQWSAHFATKTKHVSMLKAYRDHKELDPQYLTLKERHYSQEAAFWHAFRLPVPVERLLCFRGILTGTTTAAYPSRSISI